jgi:hypothetical protein
MQMLPKLLPTLLQQPHPVPRPLSTLLPRPQPTPRLLWTLLPPLQRTLLPLPSKAKARISGAASLAGVPEV